MNQIAEGAQEMRLIANEDVQMKLDGVCEMYRVDIWGLTLNFRSHSMAQNAI